MFSRSVCLPIGSWWRLALRRAFFFFNDTATTEIYTLSLHDALPILGGGGDRADRAARRCRCRSTGAARVLRRTAGERAQRDRKSTRLNSSHSQISYAVFCLKKKTTSQHANTLEYN